MMISIEAAIGVWLASVLMSAVYFCLMGYGQGYDDGYKDGYND